MGLFDAGMLSMLIPEDQLNQLQGVFAQFVTRSIQTEQRVARIEAKVDLALSMLVKIANEKQLPLFDDVQLIGVSKANSEGG